MHTKNNISGNNSSVANPFWKKSRLYMKSLAERLERWRWLILAFIGLSLLWVEIQEFLVLRILNQAFHYFEVFQYTVLLISTGLLTELFARSNRAHKHAVHILDYKHRLSLELASNDEWETLCQKLTELPSNITEDVDEAYLFESDLITGDFESIGRWVGGGTADRAETWDPSILCEKCLQGDSKQKLVFHLCAGNDPNLSQSIYSLEILNKNYPTLLLKFRLKPGFKLSRENVDVFNNIGDEIAVALRASHDRKRLSEMQSAEVAIAERRIVSSYVHDQLGQNLGYLHLKLDQLGANESVVKSKEVKKDLKHLQDVANESYEIVRNILKKIQPETIPHLTNLLREHARTVSSRANFSLNFKSLGEPTHLATNAQQLIFFTFREILSNIEKHACASKVDVLVIWNDGLLDISVADNGKGFDPRLVKGDEHFGLGIMQERITNIKGNLVINSSTESGTVVSISIPIESTQRVLV